MTREKIIHGLYRGDSRAIKEAIKTLEQESILDKIRAEVEDRPSCMLSTSIEYERGVNAMLNQVLMIIDKYKAERDSEK